MAMYTMSILKLILNAFPNNIRKETWYTGFKFLWNILFHIYSIYILFHMLWIMEEWKSKKNSSENKSKFWLTDFKA